MGWIILLVLVVGGVLIARRLIELEKEIRAEIDSVETVNETDIDSDSVKLKSNADQVTELDQRILTLIKREPGLLQKDFYSRIPDIDKAHIKKKLLELDRTGRILRKRSGNTFSLYLAGH